MKYINKYITNKKRTNSHIAATGCGYMYSRYKVGDYVAPTSGDYIIAEVDSSSKSRQFLNNSEVTTATSMTAKVAPKSHLDTIFWSTAATKCRGYTV